MEWEWEGSWDLCYCKRGLDGGNWVYWNWGVWMERVEQCTMKEGRRNDSRSLRWKNVVCKSELKEFDWRLSWDVKWKKNEGKRMNGRDEWGKWDLWKHQDQWKSVCCNKVSMRSWMTRIWCKIMIVSEISRLTRPVSPLKTPEGRDVRLLEDIVQEWKENCGKKRRINEERLFIPLKTPESSDILGLWSRLKTKNWWKGEIMIEKEILEIFEVCE